MDLQYFANKSASAVTHGLKSLDPSDNPSMFGGLSETWQAAFQAGQESMQTKQQLVGAAKGAVLIMVLAGLCKGGQYAYCKVKAKQAEKALSHETVSEAVTDEESDCDSCDIPAQLGTEE